MGLSLGDRVDRYEVLALLGTGGMGEVYRARDTKLSRSVALKVLRLDRTLGDDAGARLLREARSAAALSHPNVVAIYDAGEVSEPESLRGLHYIAMELVVGKSLKDYLLDDSVTISQRVAWARDVALALAAAHEAGIVHRDIKPENVMIRFDGVVKVLDFGIARRLAVEIWSSKDGHSLPTLEKSDEDPILTQPGSIAGTPSYMAPEQLRGEPLDGRADQFAWGVMTHSLLSRQPPWKGTSEPLLLVSQILSGDPPALSEIDGRIPPVVSGVVARSLAKARDARYRTMSDLVAALDGKPPGTLRAHVVSAGASGLPPEPPRRPRARATWVLALGLVGAGAAGVGLWRARRDEVVGATAARRAERDDHGSAIVMTGMVRLAGGTFTMGESAEERAAACERMGSRCARTTLDREQPPHQVTVSPFLLDVNEATTEEIVQWLRTEYYRRRADRGLRIERYVYDATDTNLLLDTDPTSEFSTFRLTDGEIRVLPGFEDRAATGLTWDAARNYCAYRGKRLPTEAEHDFAAGGIERRRFPWGEEEPRCSGVIYARHVSTDCAGMPLGPQPVSAGDQDWSPDRVHGLGGNVAEWVEDAFPQAFYSDCGACTDPVQIVDPGAAKEFRTVRGGSWASSINLVRSAGRSPWERSGAAPSVGVRCALTTTR